MMAAAYTFEDDPHLLRVRMNIGITGFGKSTLLDRQLAAIDKLQGKFPRQIVVDPKPDDYHFGHFGRICTTASEVSSVLGDGKLKAFKLRVITKSTDVFNHVCWEAMRAKNLFMICDEVWNFCETKSGTKMDPPEFNRLICEGRAPYFVRFIGACQRPTQIHNNLLLNCQEVNVFRTEDLGGGLKLKLQTRANQQRALGLEKLEFISCRNGKTHLCRI